MPEFQSAEPLDPAQWIPLSHLAIEGFGASLGPDSVADRIETLRREFADEALVDDIGRCCVPRRLARELFAERARQQAEAAAREAARAAELAATPDPMAEVRALVEAINSRDDIDPSLTAYQAMLGLGPEYEEAMALKSRALDEMLSGDVVLHTFGGV
jgi:hypothetical protein